MFGGLRIAFWSSAASSGTLVVKAESKKMSIGGASRHSAPDGVTVRTKVIGTLNISSGIAALGPHAARSAWGRQSGSEAARGCVGVTSR
jgi:hypothetical protein